ncbi:MAG TPA: PepSY domain-containing protein [Acidimicrobiales bacterium]|nr:PepSY domain-containing protein [Acidimicrobiales bacterium]
MQRRSKVILAAATIVVVAAGGTGAAVASGAGDDDEAPISGSALERASDAALAHTGGGRVTETEVEDEDSYYEVEVTLDDGSQVDVQLDRDFEVVASEGDDDTSDDAD